MTRRATILTYTFALSPQLKVAEAQITRAEQHLRDLRAGMLQGAPLVVVDHELALPSPPVSAQTSPPQPVEARQFPPGRPRHVQLGDAEAELLLQAAKVHSHVNRINRVPLSRVIVEQAQEIIRAAPLISANDDASAATTSAAPAFVAAPPRARNSTSVLPDPSTSSSATTASGSKALDKEKTNGLLELARVSSHENVVLPPLPVPQLAIPAPATVLPPPPLGFAGLDSGSKKRRRKSTEAASPDRRSKRLSKARVPSEPLPRHDSEDVDDDDHDTDPSALSGADSDEDGSGAWLSRGVSHEDLDHLPSPPAIFTTVSTSSDLAVAAAGPIGTRAGKPLGQRLSALDVLAQASASQEAADYAHLPADEANSTFAKGSKGKAKADPEAKARSRSASSVGPDGKKARSPYIKVSARPSSAVPAVSNRVSLSLRPSAISGISLKTKPSSER